MHSTILWNQALTCPKVTCTKRHLPKRLCCFSHTSPLVTGSPRLCPKACLSPCASCCAGRVCPGSQTLLLPVQLRSWTGCHGNERAPVDAGKHTHQYSHIRLGALNTSHLTKTEVTSEKDWVVLRWHQWFLMLINELKQRFNILIIIFI